jgi:cadmium resistance protein CadD (predicted permease)
MTMNEGTLDRTLRIVLGIALLTLTFVGPKTMLGLVGIVPLLTGLIGFCPLYALVGINTCSLQQRKPRLGT